MSPMGPQPDAEKPRPPDAGRKLSSLELAEMREAQLRQIIDLVPHMVFAKDWDGRFLLVNQAVANAYGTSVEALEGHLHSEFHPEPQQLASMLQADREVMQRGEPKLIAPMLAGGGGVESGTRVICGVRSSSTPLTVACTVAMPWERVIIRSLSA